MDEPQYSIPKLVDIYDTLNSGDEDYRFFEAIIGQPPLRIADVGCGTGRFAVELAAKGHLVVGADPAKKMIEYARQRPGGSSVLWHHGDASAIPGEHVFDVVLMTGHAFQCLITDDVLTATLSAIRRLLVDGGRLMFDSRNPTDRAWEKWTAAGSPSIIQSAAKQAISIQHQVISICQDLMTFDTIYQLAREVLRNRSTLRFLDKDSIDAALRRHGFNFNRYFGDWMASAFADDSPEIIVVAS